MRIALALVTAAVLLVACGDGGGSTPEGTFESVKKLTAAKDWDGFYDLLAPSARTQAEKEWEEKEFDSPEGKLELQMMASLSGVDAEKIPQMSLKEFFGTMAAKMTEMGGPAAAEFEKFKDAKIVDSRIEGDMATLTFKVGDREEKIEMVKEDGSWYLGGKMLKGPVSSKR
jgi:major membrane immunogen (membrane-anchored lipoprotein)